MMSTNKMEFLIDSERLILAVKVDERTVSINDDFDNFLAERNWSLEQYINLSLEEKTEEFLCDLMDYILLSGENFTGWDKWLNRDISNFEVVGNGEYDCIKHLNNCLEKEWEQKAKGLIVAHLQLDDSMANDKDNNIKTTDKEVVYGEIEEKIYM